MSWIVISATDFLKNVKSTPGPRGGSLAFHVAGLLSQRRARAPTEAAPGRSLLLAVGKAEWVRGLGRPTLRPRRAHELPQKRHTYRNVGAFFTFSLFSLQRSAGPSMSLCPQGLWLTTWRGKMPLFSAMSPRRGERTACWRCAGSSPALTRRRRWWWRWPSSAWCSTMGISAAVPTARGCACWRRGVGRSMHSLFWPSGQPIKGIMSAKSRKSASSGISGRPGPMARQRPKWEVSASALWWEM